MPDNGATTIKDNRSTSDILLGMVMLKRSFSAAKARHRGNIRKIAATIMWLIPSGI
jgi:hypothetical protein